MRSVFTVDFGRSQFTGILTRISAYVFVYDVCQPIKSLCFPRSTGCPLQCMSTNQRSLCNLNRRLCRCYTGVLLFLSPCSNPSRRLYRCYTGVSFNCFHLPLLSWTARTSFQSMRLSSQGLRLSSLSAANSECSSRY